MVKANLMVEDKLRRFINAQEGLIYMAVKEELSNGKKQTHWMWFIFPQLNGLGNSSIAKYYGIESLAEARAYWDHPLLGARLKECISIVNGLSSSAEDIFGSIDAQKFRSCLTLFLQINTISDKSLLQKALNHFYGGQLDQKTLTLLEC